MTRWWIPVDQAPQVFPPHRRRRLHAGRAIPPNHLGRAQQPEPCEVQSVPCVTADVKAWPRTLRATVWR